jgi:hypothetical protein
MDFCVCVTIAVMCENGEERVYKGGSDFLTILRLVWFVTQMFCIFGAHASWKDSV